MSSVSVEKWKKYYEARKLGRDPVRVESFEKRLGLVRRWVLPGFCVFVKGETDE